MDKKNFTLSFSIPFPRLMIASKIHAFEQSLSHHFSTFYGNISNMVSPTSRSNFFSKLSSPIRYFRRFKFNKRSFVRYFLPVVVLLIVVFLIRSVFVNRATTSSTLGATQSPGEDKALAKASINREFSFPIKDDKGKEIYRFSYTLADAELRNEIIVKGSRAKAVVGRTFLIINLKLTNSNQQGLQINARDYVRLSINNNKSELLAADIHNDPVEVQAISTKYTRIGFPINSSDTNLSLQVGEIGGSKETIELKFHK